MAGCCCHKGKCTLGDRVRCAKILFQFLGAIVGLLFALQGVLIFIGPAVSKEEHPLTNFWQVCHWISEGALCVLVGLFSFIMEARACCTRVKAHTLRFAANRTSLALVYLWLGAYSAGNKMADRGAEFRALSHGTGILAWIVAIAHLCLSCCAERNQEKEELDEEAVSDEDSEESEDPNKTTGTAASNKAEPGNAAHSGANASEATGSDNFTGVADAEAPNTMPQVA